MGNPDPSSPIILKVYDPTQYAFAGFLFSLIPVFIMSFILLVWSLYTTAQSLGKTSINDQEVMMRILSNADPAQIAKELIPQQVQFAPRQGGVDSSDIIFLLLNLIFFIVVIGFTKRAEAPIFKELKAKNQIQIRPLFVPVLSGIIFMTAVYFGMQPLAEAVTKLLI